VLTIRKIGSGQAGDYSAYLAGRAQDEHEAWQATQGDYYTGSNDDAPDAAGIWRGDASTLSALGVELDAVVQREELARALRGLRADNGERLRRPGANGVVNSHDLTMGAPKSVSVLWAQSDGERRAAIEQAVRDAAESTVRYMALTTGCVQRRTDNGDRVWEPARGVASAHFVHHTARRASDASVPDPHLHVHCVVVAVERSDGRIVTPNQGAWVRHGREGGAYFRSELASRLLELGLQIEHGTGKQGRFFEVGGVPHDVCERLSGRSREVETAYTEFVARYGRAPVDRELSDLATKSRERKGPETVAEIEPYWRAVAAEHGFDQAAAARLWGREIERAPAVDDVRNQVEAEVLARIERQGATVRSREVRAMAYEASAGLLASHEAMQLVADMQKRGLLLALTDDRVTTRNTRAHERYCLDTTATIATDPVRPPSAATVEVAIKATERAFDIALSDEQSAAVEVATSDARLAGLVGRAGSGKGVVIHAASNAYRDDGWQVLACATQGARAQGLAAQTSGAAMTINQLVHRANSGRVAVDARTVVFIDEAGMVDTFRMTQLVHLVERTGCSIRLVGDPAQLSAIGPGGLLPSMLAVDLVPVAELTEIHRAQHQWMRDAQNYVRAGDSMRALELLARHDALHMDNTQAEARIRMVADWNRWRHDYAIGDTLMVVHTTNEDVDRVNMLAQAYRGAAGELGDASVTSPDRDYQLHEGDRVMLRESAYYPGQQGEPRVENGTRGIIVTVDTAANTVDVLLDEPGHDQQRVVTFELDRCDALRLDYASHVYPSQGDTRSRTAELTGGPSVNRENAYVGGSRQRDRHDLYTSREALGTDGDDTTRWNRLADQMNESRAQTPSIAYHEENYRRIAVQPPHPVLDREVAQLDRIEHDLRAAKAHHEQLHRQFPSHEQHTLTRFETSRDDVLESAKRADQHVQRYERKLAELRPWQREQIKSVRREIEQWTERRDHSYQRSDEWAQSAERIKQDKRSPERWNQKHGADLAARKQLVDDLTRQRDDQRERVAERAIEAPPRYLTRVLGERPDDPAKRETWDQAVRSVETYRAKHHVHERHTTLGREPNGGTQHWDFKHAVEHIDDARRAIGHTRDTHAIAHHRDGHSRGIGREIGGRGL
jgi:conjugative relaxase-like TrwC/TraI family protein